MGCGLLVRWGCGGDMNYGFLVVIGGAMVAAWVVVQIVLWRRCGLWVIGQIGLWWRRELWVSSGRGQCDGGSVEIVVRMGYGFWWILVGIGWAVGWRLGGCGLVFGWPDQWWLGVWVLGFFCFVGGYWDVCGGGVVVVVVASLLER